MCTCGPDRPGPADTDTDVIMMGRVNAARSAAPGRTRPAVWRAAPGSDGGAGGAGSGGHGATPADPAGVVFPAGSGAHAARLVWGVLTAAVDPLSATAIGLSATVAPQLAHRALEYFERAGLVLCIPDEDSGRGARGKLWVLAGGVREGLDVAAAAAEAKPAPGGYGHGPALLAEAAVGHPAQAPDLGGQGAEDGCRTATGRVGLAAVLPFPKKLAGARPGHRRVWKVLIEADRVLRTVEVAEAAGISRSAAASALSSLARVRAVRRFREDGCDNWVLPPADLAARDEALGLTRPAPLAAPGPEPGAGRKPRPADPVSLPASDAPLPPAALAPRGNGEKAAVGAVSGLRRLRKGELEAMVLKALRERYPEELGPTGLSHLLGGYSSGAITNVLGRLQVKEQAEMTCPAPKRYRAIPAAEGKTPRRRLTA